MANNRKASTQTASTQAKLAKPAATFERAKLLCPDDGRAERIAETFGLNLPDYEDIRDQHSLALMKMTDAFAGVLNEKATAMHFQRIVGSLVSSAVGAGSFYSDKVLEARAAATRGADGGEERDAPAGFESKARRVAEFAAEMGLQAYALLAAAQGAVETYKEITGEEWAPYRATNEAQLSLDQRSLKAQLDAF